MNGGEWDAGLEQMQAYLDAYDGSEEGKSGRVESLSARTHTPVLIIRTEEEAAALPTRREHRAKGWYDTEKGEVVIVLPNNVNVADVDNTFVHEVIGHKGFARWWAKNALASYWTRCTDTPGRRYAAR